MSKSVKHLHETNEHYTPLDVVGAVREVLGTIDLDPASTSFVNKNRVKATDYFTREDGTATFEKSWKGNVFLNPPGGKKMVVKGTGFNSNPVLFWAKLMHDWKSGSVNAAIFLGFTIEIIQTTQSVEEFPALRFPFCVPRKRLNFAVSRRRKIRQLWASREKAGTTEKRESIDGQIQALQGQKEAFVPEKDPPHGNVLVLVPPREEHFFGVDFEEKPWVGWKGAYTSRFQQVFSQLGYVRL